MQGHLSNLVSLPTGLTTTEKSTASQINTFWYFHSQEGVNEKTHFTTQISITLQNFTMQEDYSVLPKAKC